MFKLQGCVALVTGSNRGLGKVFCEHLLQAGASKIYAGARDPSKIVHTDTRIIPVRLDITSTADIATAMQSCQDLTLLVNNAGIARNSPMIHPDAQSAARDEMNTNYFGTLSMVQGFAPILAKNGGGAILNVLSTSSWITNPFLATYSASKMATAALTDAIRIQLRSQGTRVVGVYAGFIDTDMAAHINRPKTSPHQIVERSLAGLETGVDRVLADDRSVEVDTRLRVSRAAFDVELQQLWDTTQM
jgi:NAD(P)-dependent dehydrogenase (short-subunit alcohol dehydrogenase family)